MACDHSMMLMSDHDNAYDDAMLMVNMQANTRSVTQRIPGRLRKWRVLFGGLKNTKRLAKW